MRQRSCKPQESLQFTMKYTILGRTPHNNKLDQETQWINSRIIMTTWFIWNILEDIKAIYTNNIIIINFHYHCHISEIDVNLYKEHQDIKFQLIFNASPSSADYPLWWKWRSAIFVVEDDCKDSVGTDSKKEQQWARSKSLEIFVKVDFSSWNMKDSNMTLNRM